MIADSFSPSAESTSSNTARAAGKASARALPMPTAWEPCPGNVNAAVIGAPSLEWGRKTLTEAGMSSRGAGSAGGPGFDAVDRVLEAACRWSPPTSLPARARRTLLTSLPGRSSWSGLAVASRSTAG